MLQEPIGTNAEAPIFCDLNAICDNATSIGYELQDLPCDEKSPAITEKLIIGLVYREDGTCHKCGIKLKPTKKLDNTLICPKCKRIFSSVPMEAKRWVISERGLAEFTARRIAEHDWAQPVGDVYHLGEIGQRDIFFGIQPKNQFFNTHGKNTALVLGSSNAKVPDCWPGSAVLFSELFYYNPAKNTIGIAPNILDNLIPRKSKGLRRGKNRVIHERRDYWLQFLANLLDKPFNPKNFYKGTIRRGVVCKWFVENIPDAPHNPRTYKRDYDGFRTYRPEIDNYDFREPAIILLLKQAADPKFKRRKEASAGIVELLLKLKKGAEDEGHAIEIPKCEWQYTGDKAGTRELVAVTPDRTGDIEI